MTLALVDLEKNISNAMDKAYFFGGGAF